MPRIINSTEELKRFSGDPVGQIALREDLTTVPREILEYAPHVRILDLSGNALSELPEWFAQLPQLEVIFLSRNRFSHVPEVLGQLASLRMIGMRDNQIESISPKSIPAHLEWLTLTSNFIADIPPELGRAPRLRKLLLAGNRLTCLPDSFSGSRSLELVRLSANRFESFPPWLFRLPSLAWVALAGNPCTQRALPGSGGVRTVSWSDLTIGKELGRGASGQTFRAILRNPQGQEESVAVKVFSTQVSSDGDGRDEIAAAVAAARHPNLVSTQAVLRDHPLGCAGLVLDLIPEGFSNLAKPPSFESCTRDVYPHPLSLEIERIREYAVGIAQAAQHLHSCGIIHGDLYAHNVLVSRNHALVSDFGAACIYRDSRALNSAMLERIEVCAYGILLHELLSCVVARSEPLATARVSALRDVASRCCFPRVEARPSFGALLQSLDPHIV
jgi:hypothetical protein